MEKISSTHKPHLPPESLKRIDMVVAACIAIGYVNREVLVDYYDLTPLQASVLLREFLTHRVNDIRHDAGNNGYALIGYPSHKPNKAHKNTH